MKSGVGMAPPEALVPGLMVRNDELEFELQVVTLGAMEALKEAEEEHSRLVDSNYKLAVKVHDLNRTIERLRNG